MRYVALLRGINVGGATMMKMDALKAGFEGLGFENVRSYINSGNIAFDTRKTSEKKLADKIEAAVEARFGRAVAVVVREQKDIGRILDNNPFAGEYESHKEMHVLFLKESMPAEKAKLLTEAALEGERYEVRDTEIYAHLRTGVADSLLTKGFLDKKLKIVFTGRNWRTVEKLAEL
jgi:uncharacterized protein (DUF1697 family)